VAGEKAGLVDHMEIFLGGMKILFFDILDRHMALHNGGLGHSRRPNGQRNVICTARRRPVATQKKKKKRKEKKGKGNRTI
jgi:hypothetical protein